MKRWLRAWGRARACTRAAQRGEGALSSSERRASHPRIACSARGVPRVLDDLALLRECPRVAVNFTHVTVGLAQRARDGGLRGGREGAAAAAVRRVKRNERVSACEERARVRAERIVRRRLGSTGRRRI